MADKIYQGKNVRLIIDDKKIFHATDCGISATRELESIATKDTDGNVQTPGAYSWTASLSTLVAQQDPATGTHFSFKDVYQKFLDGTPCQFQYTTGATGDMVFTGEVYITQADFSAPTTGAATGSFSFTGNGNLVLDVIE